MLDKITSNWKALGIGGLVFVGLIYAAIAGIYQAGYKAAINEIKAAPVRHDTTIVHDTLTFHAITERIVAKPVPVLDAESARALDSLVNSCDSLQQVIQTLAQSFTAHAGDSTYALDMTAYPPLRLIDYTLTRAPIPIDHMIVNSSTLLTTPAERYWWEIPVAVLAGGAIGYTASRIK